MVWPTRTLFVAVVVMADCVVWLACLILLRAPLPIFVTKLVAGWCTRWAAPGPSPGIGPPEVGFSMGFELWLFFWPVKFPYLLKPLLRENWSRGLSVAWPRPTLPPYPDPTIKFGWLNWLWPGFLRYLWFWLLPPLRFILKTLVQFYSISLCFKLKASISLNFWYNCYSLLFVISSCCFCFFFLSFYSSSFRCFSIFAVSWAILLPTAKARAFYGFWWFWPI